MTDDQPVVGGRYQLGEVLGRGGMAEVRRGIDVRLGRTVAIKRLSPELAADPTFQTRFQREAHAVASLNHPAIAAVFDSGEEVDDKTGISIPYIVMELVEGSTLRDVLREGRRLLPERALELTRGVLDALGHSHTAGIIHRDIKPANVMLTPGGAVKVMDFGIARAATDTSTSLTQTASVIGTAQYLSPEQARGESVDLRSDIYSTGCLLYELLTGQPPFSGDSSVSVAYQHVREPPKPPSQLDPQLGPEMDAVTLKALAKDPADRYQTAAEMSADLGRILAGQPPLALGAAAGSEIGATTLAAAVPTQRVESVPATVVADPPRRRNVERTVLIAAAVLLLISGLTYGAFRLFGSGGAELVSVPSVVGASQASADTRLRDLDLVSSVVSVHGPKDDTMNDVINQNPAAGTEIPSGSTVTIEVNVGPPDAKIPGDLIGEDVDDAKEALKKAGFTSVRTEKATDPPSDAKKGEVVSVDPDEGTEVALGEEVTLTYVSDDPAKSTPTSTPTADATKSSAPTKSAAPSKSASTEEPSKSSPPTKSADPPPSSEPEESTKPTQSSETTDPQSSQPTDPSESAKAVRPAQASTSPSDEQS